MWTCMPNMIRTEVCTYCKLVHERRWTNLRQLSSSPNLALVHSLLTRSRRACHQPQCWRVMGCAQERQDGSRWRKPGECSQQQRRSWLCVPSEMASVQTEHCRGEPEWPCHRQTEFGQSSGRPAGSTHTHTYMRSVSSLSEDRTLRGNSEYQPESLASPPPICLCNSSAFLCIGHFLRHRGHICLLSRVVHEEKGKCNLFYTDKKTPLSPQVALSWN